MNTWFTSDTHFGHSNIIKYCSRPFATREEMDCVMIDNWNKVVKPEDVVYHLGDFSFHKKDRTEEIIKQLHGIKVIIRGNHDRHFTDTWFLEHGFKHIFYKSRLQYGDTVFEMVHNPDHHEHYFPGFVYLCGHVHDRWKISGAVYNVGVDVHNFTPVNANEIIKEMVSVK